MFPNILYINILIIKYIHVLHVVFAWYIFRTTLIFILGWSLLYRLVNYNYLKVLNLERERDRDREIACGWQIRLNLERGQTFYNKTEVKLDLEVCLNYDCRYSEYSQKELHILPKKMYFQKCSSKGNICVQILFNKMSKYLRGYQKKKENKKWPLDRIYTI